MSLHKYKITICKHVFFLNKLSKNYIVNAYMCLGSWEGSYYETTKYCKQEILILEQSRSNYKLDSREYLKFHSCPFVEIRYFPHENANRVNFLDLGQVIFFSGKYLFAQPTLRLGRII